MLRTIFVIGFFALAGLFALKLVFGIMPALLGLVWWLLMIAIKIAIIGAIIYFVIRLVSPDTARRLRTRWSSNSF